MMNIIAADTDRAALAQLLQVIRTAAPQAVLNGFDDPTQALRFAQTHPCDVAFLEVDMTPLDGIALATQLKRHAPDINIIFATAAEHYRREAFALHASGYLTKPIDTAHVAAELGDLRRPIPQHHRVRVKAFGNFEVFADGKPVAFRYTKTKELLAYLIDRKGALCTTQELMAIIFEDDRGHKTYMKSLRRDLLDTFTSLGCLDIISQQRGKLGVVPEQMDCDYYDWCAGKRGGIMWQGEYMMQYSWSEYTAGILERMSRVRTD